MTAIPKPKRLVNRKLLDSYHAMPCAVCGTNQGVVGHHIKSVGSGGSDVKENLIALCVTHHSMIHQYGNIRMVELFPQLAKYYP